MIRPAKRSPASPVRDRRGDMLVMMAFAIVGQERTIPLYDTVTDNGNNTYFHIVGFAGIRIVDVTLTGGDKYVMIQPAVVTDGAAVGNDGNGPSYQFFDPVVLIK